MEIVPIINPNSFKIIDFEERKNVLEHNLWHMSSLILPIKKSNKSVLIQRRPFGKTYAGKLDVYGGFVNKNPLTEKLHQKFDKNLLYEIFLSTALREINEELEIKINGKRILSNEKDLISLGGFGDFIADNEINKEVSAAFLYVIPSNATVNTFDDVNGINVKIKSSFYYFSDIVKDFIDHPNNFAGAAQRIFSQYVKNPQIKKVIDSFFDF